MMELGKILGKNLRTARRFRSTERVCLPLTLQHRNFASSDSVSDDKKEVSHIIIGAGSAGSTLANRISADSGKEVLLLEAGRSDRGSWDSWKIHMPAALVYNLCDDKYNWFYHVVPQRHMNNRVMYWPRGKVLGGSSSLNAMVYIRGHALDYDNWESMGAEGWAYKNVLPYFKKAQSHELGEDDYRGGNGPLHVSRGTTNNPLNKAFIDAMVQAGYPKTEDMNGYQQEGAGWMDMTVHKGRRWSAAAAYLHPVLHRPNLRVETEALSHRILFEGKRAVGVEYTVRGETKRAFASEGVILSGGAINSPQLLMLSGVGPKKHLEEMDIPLVQDLPGVGQNLQDHLECYVQYECTKPLTLYHATWRFPHRMVAIGAQWFLTQKGWGASSHLEAGGFIRSQPGVRHPDIQFHFLPSGINDHGRIPLTRHAMQVHVGSMRAESRGYIKLKSKNPLEHPEIDPNYLATEQDRREMRDCVKLSREIFEQKAFEEFRGAPIQPLDDVRTDAQIDAWIREKADSAYHPSCTCKMGQDDLAVVDPQTRVHGLEGLHVVDASIMPQVVSGNLNGPTIMIAEKAADLILGKPPLEPSNAPVYEAPDWQTKQR